MDGALVEQKACEIRIAPQCDSSDNEQGGFGKKKTVECRKRKGGSLTDVLGVKGSYSPPKQIPWCIGFKSTRASESESELSESSSTVYFVKGYESAVTAVVSDSEDDLFFLNETVETVEYEPPDSDAEEPEEEAEDEDESETDDIISSEEEDPGAEGGDEYEGDRESDSEFDEDDFWACSHCDLKNHPFSPRCARCWRERQAWLPTLKRLTSEANIDLSGLTDKSCLPSLQKSSSLAVTPTIDHPSSTVALSTVAPLPNFASHIEGSSSSVKENTERLSHASNHATSQAENPNKTLQQNYNNENSATGFTPDLCIICLMQPRNASIVHGRTGHLVCCIGCAERLKEEKKKCPVCRKKIKLVINVSC